MERGTAEWMSWPGRYLQQGVYKNEKQEKLSVASLRFLHKGRTIELKVSNISTIFGEI